MRIEALTETPLAEIPAGTVFSIGEAFYLKTVSGAGSNPTALRLGDAVYLGFPQDATADRVYGNSVLSIR